MLRFGRFGVLALAALALNGCALALGALASTAGSGAGLGIQHNINGVVSKTYTASMPELRSAMLLTLDRMSVGVNDDKQTGEGWLITGKAQDREISLRLQELTPTTTRARVSVDNDAVFKDSSTAEEILAQTSRALDEVAAIQIENGYAAMTPGSKKTSASQKSRTPAKTMASKPPLSQPASVKLASTRDPQPAPLPLPPKAQLKVALAKEHI
jgi:hypothetical protein